MVIFPSHLTYKFHFYRFLDRDKNVPRGDCHDSEFMIVPSRYIFITIKEAVKLDRPKYYLIYLSSVNKTKYISFFALSKSFICCNNLTVCVLWCMSNPLDGCTKCTMSLVTTDPFTSPNTVTSHSIRRAYLSLRALFLKVGMFIFRWTLGFIWVTVLSRLIWKMHMFSFRINLSI